MHGKPQDHQGAYSAVLPWARLARCKGSVGLVSQPIDRFMRPRNNETWSPSPNNNSPSSAAQAIAMFMRIPPLAKAHQEYQDSETVSTAAAP
jgi:hypothetical protein